MSTTTPATSPPASQPTPAPAKTGGRPLIREWHTMSADEQTTEWQALVAWVAWIHDLYELSRNERLPRCWPQHGGLVEELRSLKAWREHIYDTPGAASSPHTARSWHGELRQSITAATTVWAPGCRVGHQASDLLDPDRLATWTEHGPPMLASAPHHDTVLGDTISMDAMTAAITAGTARRHSSSIPHYVHHDGSWWTRDADGAAWHRCTDSTHAARLDRTSDQLRDADAALDRHAQRKDQ